MMSFSVLVESINWSVLLRKQIIGNHYRMLPTLLGKSKHKDFTKLGKKIDKFTSHEHPPTENMDHEIHQFHQDLKNIAGEEYSFKRPIRSIIKFGSRVQSHPIDTFRHGGLVGKTIVGAPVALTAAGAKTTYDFTVGPALKGYMYVDDTYHKIEDKAKDLYQAVGDKYREIEDRTKELYQTAGDKYREIKDYLSHWGEDQPHDVNN